MTRYTIGTNNEYKTRDLHEAAFLYAKGKKLLRLEGGGREFWFVFDEADGCEVLANSYWANEVEVLAKSYADSLRTLKDRVFSRKAE
ncbi:hypothetical protein A2780_02530 [Candidatus Daviesbacteria bacterium RIFCSPHIGHO2_01_FULL_41_45]|nr:MAG: hypothetical protein A2780_02530 [Candidatus Daviesbacteria bacterium RIFCSPHIGHO2_01_FULL_41_45]